MNRLKCFDVLDTTTMNKYLDVLEEIAIKNHKETLPTCIFDTHQKMRNYATNLYTKLELIQSYRRYIKDFSHRLNIDTEFNDISNSRLVTILDKIYLKL